MPKLPHRGLFLALKQPNIDVYDSDLRRVMSIGPAAVRDREDADLRYLPVTGTIVDCGAAYGRYMGTGTTITRSFSDSKRTINQSVAVAGNNITIQQTTSYLADVDVHREGFLIRWRRNMTLVVGNDAIVHRGGNFIYCWTDNGDVELNWYMDATGTTIYQNWQSRLSDQERKACIQVLSKYDVVLEKLNQPNGYLATLVITNHADSTSIPAVKALFYGASDTGHPNYGNKGFIPRGIKTTWSVFAVTVGNSPGLDNPELLDLMDAVYGAGHEVIPHRMRYDQNEHRTDVATHLPTYYTHFASRNWIDHDVRDDTIAAIRSGGWNAEDAVNYIMDLLKSYGYQYVWAFLDVSSQNGVKGVNMLRGKPEFIGIPRWVIYQNTNLNFGDGTMPWQWWGWRTTQPGLTEHFVSSAIDALIREYGFTLIHEYLAHSSQDGYMFVSGTPYTITDLFDEQLQYIASKIAAGELWNPTCSEFMDYWVKMSQVNVRKEGGKSYKLTNNSGSVILGFNMRAIKVDIYPKLDEEAISNRKIAPDGSTIFWFDLPVGEHTISF